MLVWLNSSSTFGFKREGGWCNLDKQLLKKVAYDVNHGCMYG
jgi:hypothetical protein